MCRAIALPHYCSACALHFGVYSQYSHILTMPAVESPESAFWHLIPYNTLESYCYPTCTHIRLSRHLTTMESAFAIQALTHASGIVIEQMFSCSCSTIIVTIERLFCSFYSAPTSLICLVNSHLITESEQESSPQLYWPYMSYAGYPGVEHMFCSWVALPIICEGFLAP